LGAPSVRRGGSGVGAEASARAKRERKRRLRRRGRGWERLAGDDGTRHGNDDRSKIPHRNDYGWLEPKWLRNIKPMLFYTFLYFLRKP
jgi:hypothetical protein